MYYAGPVDLKKKYKATWALVTGAGTGIGKSIAETMAIQGLNVVLVSLPDKYLEETTDELKKRFPHLQFRSVPAKFDHKTDYMPTIIKVILFPYHVQWYYDLILCCDACRCRPLRISI
jgi:hypothetical protein